MNGNLTRLKYILLTLFIVALASEIFLVKQNLELRKKLIDHKNLKALSSQLQSRLDSINFKTSFEGKCLPLFVQPESYWRVAKPNNGIGSRFIVMFFFLTTDCGSCLYNEISTWNDFSATVDGKLCRVLGVTDAYNLNLSGFDNIKDSFNIKFPLIKVDNLKSQLNKLDINSTPAVLFGDAQTKKCLYAFFPTPLSKSSDVFAKKLQLILEDCYR